VKLWVRILGKVKGGNTENYTGFKGVWCRFHGAQAKQEDGAWSDKNNRRKDFKKLHIIADLVNRAIVAQKLTEGRRHDSPVFKEMMDDVESVDKMTGDPAQQG